MPQVEEQRPQVPWEFRFFTVFMFLFVLFNVSLDLILHVTDIFRMSVVAVVVYIATIRLVGFQH